MVLAVTVCLAACAEVDPLTVDTVPPSTSLAPDTTTSSPDATSTSSQATSSTTAPPVSNPWGIEVVEVTDYELADVADGVAEVIRPSGIVEATIVEIGDSDGRWCCENPPFRVTDVVVIAGTHEDRGGAMNGVSYQHLERTLKPGDRVTILDRGGTTDFVFNADGSLAHPIPPHQVEAIEALAEGDAAWFGVPASRTPLEIVYEVWTRYGPEDRYWWGPVDQRVALALSGTPGYQRTCSSGDMQPLVDAYDYPAATSGLTEEAAATRQRLIDAAITCDLEALIQMSGYQPSTEDHPVDVDAFWWNAMDTVENFAETDRHYGILRELVYALTGTPVAERVSGDTTTFVWPAAYGIDYEASSFTDAFDLDSQQRIAGMNDVTPEQMAAQISEFGGYIYFRTGITAAGQWSFALAGD